ncbi:DUF4129 domain-containing protein [Streptomyces sp. NPDC101237]|uniref:DUF4129 domain-containing protein n=1 Tax=Streptomyces sp. NPDC101237 TaxID=3366139 RepID=UPI003815ED4A
MGRERIPGVRRRHGTTGVAQAASAVLVVGGLALAALLLRPGTDLMAKGRGPLGGNGVLVVGLALIAFLGGLALRERYRDRIGTGRELTAVEQRLADGMHRVLPAAALLVPLLALVLHRFGTSGASDQVDRRPSPPPTPPRDLLPTPPPGHHAEHPGGGMHLGLSRVLLVVAVAVLVAVVVTAALRLWRHLGRPLTPDTAATYAVLDDEQDRLAQAVDLGRHALTGTADARAAVIACYAAMEESLAESGVTRHASDSPQDLLERAVADGLPTEAAAAALTALFREARYSTHPMDGHHRDRAAAALAEIADGLRTRSARHAVTGTP